MTLVSLTCDHLIGSGSQPLDKARPAAVATGLTADRVAACSVRWTGASSPASLRRVARALRSGLRPTSSARSTRSGRCAWPPPATGRVRPLLRADTSHHPAMWRAASPAGLAGGGGRGAARERRRGGARTRHATIHASIVTVGGANVLDLLDLGLGAAPRAREGGAAGAPRRRPLHGGYAPTSSREGRSACSSTGGAHGRGAAAGDRAIAGGPFRGGRNGSRVSRCGGAPTSGVPPAPAATATLALAAGLDPRELTARSLYLPASDAARPSGGVSLSVDAGAGAPLAAGIALEETRSRASAGGASLTSRFSSASRSASSPAGSSANTTPRGPPSSAPSASCSCA